MHNLTTQFSIKQNSIDKEPCKLSLKDNSRVKNSTVITTNTQRIDVHIVNELYCRVYE